MRGMDFNEVMWRSRLKVGDPTLYCTVLGMNYLRTLKVARFTQTQIVLEDGKRVSKQTGYIVGSSERFQILEPTANRLASIEASKRKAVAQ